MNQNLTLVRTYIRKLYNKYDTTDSKKMWVRVPNTCKSRIDKENVIYSTIDFLERNIKINKHE